MLRKTFQAILQIAALLLAAGAARADGHGAPPPTPCAEKPVAAAAIRSADDIEAFVQCAYEYLEEMGDVEAYRAFHNDARWKSGQFYVFVVHLGRRVTPIFPPDRSRENQLWGAQIDSFETDFMDEFRRTIALSDRGWVYYEFTNPETNLTEPKASYIIRTKWGYADVVIGAGIYRRDFPGACHPAQVNAALVEAEPSMERLREFVRCATLEVETKGYFGTRMLQSGPRWRAGSIYLFGMDMGGNQLFSGNPLEIDGSRAAEWGRDPKSTFNGRDMIDVAATFGESTVYYRAVHPETGVLQRKASFVKRVSGQGIPLLIGAGIYLGD